MRHLQLRMQRRSQAAQSFLLSSRLVDRVRGHRWGSCRSYVQCGAAASLQTLRTSSRPCSSRAVHGPSLSSSTVEPELISLDCIEVIGTTMEAPTSNLGATTAERVSSFTVRDAQKDETTAAPSCTSTDAHAASSTTGMAAAGPHCVVHAVDPFARGRIANFIRRMDRIDGDIFRVKEISQVDGSDPTGRVLPPLYVATCRVPLPEPHGFHIAKGLGKDKKEAELLAAMHAERVCDALGVPLFRLKTAQQKHAETVRRKEGRYAPFPGDPVKPLGTPVPPPLRLLHLQLPSSPAPDRDAASSGSCDSNEGSDQAHKTSSGVSLAEVASAVPPSERTREGCSASLHHMADGLNAKMSARVSLSSEHLAASRAGPSGCSLSSDEYSASASPAVDSTDTTANDPSFTWPTVNTTTFLCRYPYLNESRRHDPYRLYDAYVPTFSDAEHAERVRSYASTVVYPWQNGWEGAMNAQEEVEASLRRGSPMADDSRLPISTVAAAAAAAITSVNFDPTENGLWEMVNDRNMRCSPTPDDALVLPYVFDGPHALARITAYYQQHGTTLEEHTKVRSVVTPGYTSRMTEVELRLVGVSVTARGKSQTEEVALRLAAMHAELLLDALGLPLFPKDSERQARHAAAVAGYGRWATNPLSDSTVSPNPHDALPRPLKSQVGTDDVWLSADASSQQRSRRTESEHIIATHNFLTAQSEDNIEVNPPSELLEEAYAMLREWQVHVARSRYTNLYVLFDMGSNLFRATTITPVPACFGVRGGSAMALSHEKAMQLCALHAMDTLCALGVPLCVDAVQERRYLQRRAALGQVLPNALSGVKRLRMGILPHNASNAGRKAFLDSLRAKEGASISSGNALGVPAGAASSSSAPTIPYLPSYSLEGQQIRLPPSFVDTVHAMQLRIPQDFCLYSGAEDTELSNMGNEVKICVCNYIEHCVDARISRLKESMASMGLSAPKYASPYIIGPTSPPKAEAVAFNEEEPPKDEILSTELWAAKYLRNTPPSVYVTGYASQLSVHCIAYLQLPLPNLPITAAAESKDSDPKGSGTTATVHSAGGSPASANYRADKPAYVIATGMSLKRKDAIRACYVHAASLLYALGIDVLSTFPLGVPRIRRVPNYAALEKCLGKEAVIIIPPFTLDGERNTQPLGSDAYAGACIDLDGTKGQNGADDASVRGPPRAVLHNVMKMFLEDPRHATPPKRRHAMRPNHPFMPNQRRRG
ncbi:hypothetical protein ABL78_5383 [Leptomonas seymouri]|uniref:REH2 DRSM domain-containing protein n=1 Tax=Leptomonas seymouri TaxID=5684 RepID=A0A0N1PCK8_LEPSE|nr:hypothetical protein ABL78_5383 [Leptomonas seymouri]|eukprot:KPI85554.1 hypothetical protein ABL78_5383 [Leptomonas seymouri]